MENSEQQIVIVKNVIADLSNYDVYLTDRRIVVVHTWNVPTWGAAGGFVGSLIAEGVEALVSSRKKKKMENLTLDEILVKDKKSYVIPYESIEQIKLKSRKLEISAEQFSKLSLTYNRWKKFTLNKEQFEQLSTILPSIAALKGKLVK